MAIKRNESDRKAYLEKSRAAFHAALNECGMERGELYGWFSRKMIGLASEGRAVISENARYSAAMKDADALAFCRAYARKLWDLDYDERD